MQEVPTSEVYTDLAWLRGNHVVEERPHIALNMVSSLDGRAAFEGKAGSIGGYADRLAMRNLRIHADAVMIGAGTLRAERIDLSSSGSIRDPLAIILSYSGHIPISQNLLSHDPERTILFVPYGSEASKALSKHGTVTALPASDSIIPLNAVLKTIYHDYGVKNLIVEGGPSLYGQLIYEDLVDEIFMTLSPKILAGDPKSSPPLLLSPSIPKGLSNRATLVSIYLHDNEVLLRYSLNTTSTTSSFR